MPGEEIIDEIADDRIRFVAEFRYNPADENAGTAMPFQIDDAVGFPRAVDLRPAMRATCAKMFRRDELELLLELRVAHDFVPQRTSARRHHLDYRLHSLGVL